MKSGWGTWGVAGILFAVYGHGCGKPPSREPVGVTSERASERTTSAEVLADPLPSWRPGPTKDAIVTFVARVTHRGSPDFVPEAERVAAFDNDGTLWQEKPVAQLAFVFDRLRVEAATNDALRTTQPFKAALERDVDYFEKEGERAFVPLLTETHGGMTEDAFESESRVFFERARHPKFGVPYTSLSYRPMIELLGYLGANGFSVYVCSGGDTDFMRAVTKSMYGLGPERIIGSTMKRTGREENGTIVLFRERELANFNDKLEKPVNLETRIGRRPLFAAGNVGTGGDVAMLEFSHGRKGPSFQMLVRHDDAEREFDYGATDDASLSAARANGFVVVSMKRDWARVFDANVRQP